MIPTDLPSAVSEFIDAINAFDASAALRCFSSNPIVNDHRTEFAGRASVASWIQRELIADRVTLEVVDAERHGDGATVRAKVDGNFDKRNLPPVLVLSFYFSVTAGQIDQLVIVNLAPAQSPLDLNRELVRQFFRHFEAGDVPAAIALFEPTATYWIPTTRRAYSMPEFAAALEWIRSRLPGGIRFTLGPIVAEPGQVSVIAESHATTAEGTPFNNHYQVYFEVKNGRFVQAREYNDTAHVFATLRAGANDAP